MVGKRVIHPFTKNAQVYVLNNLVYHKMHLVYLKQNAFVPCLL